MRSLLPGTHGEAARGCSRWATMQIVISMFDLWAEIILAVANAPTPPPPGPPMHLRYFPSRNASYFSGSSLKMLQPAARLAEGGGVGVPDGCFDRKLPHPVKD